MGAFITVAKISEIEKGTQKTVVVHGKRIAVANVDGQFFAVDDTCTHAECSLGEEGFLNDNVITCGCHGAQFDVTTGKVIALPATADLKTYEVKAVGEDVQVNI